MKKEIQTMMAGLLAMAGSMDKKLHTVGYPSPLKYPKRRDALSQEEQDEKILKADKKRKRKFAKKHGYELHEICAEFGCFGIMEELEREGSCSCHTGNPPCPYCTDSIIAICSECGAEKDMGE